MIDLYNEDLQNFYHTLYKYGPVLPVVETSKCAKKCANDVPLGFGWASAGLRLAS